MSETLWIQECAEKIKQKSLVIYASATAISNTEGLSNTIFTPDIYSHKNIRR